MASFKISVCELDIKITTNYGNYVRVRSYIGMKTKNLLI